MIAKAVRNALKIAAVCAMGAPFAAYAQMGNQPYNYNSNNYGYSYNNGYSAAPSYPYAADSGHYRNAPGASYSAANGGPPVRGNNLPSGGIYNGSGYGHAYPEGPR